MSGKRLLDAAAVFKASWAVALKYAALRQHWDTSKKSSPLAQAGVTFTLRAASTLAGRLNESGPRYSKQSP